MHLRIPTSAKEKVEVVETAAEFFAQRAKKGDKRAFLKFLKFLKTALDVPPLPGDEIE